jgi:hypothetical protein
MGPESDQQHCREGWKIEQTPWERQAGFIYHVITSLATKQIGDAAVNSG